jgi:hypothetical protein
MKKQQREALLKLQIEELEAKIKRKNSSNFPRINNVVLAVDYPLSLFLTHRTLKLWRSKFKPTDVNITGGATGAPAHVKTYPKLSPLR